MPHYYEQTPRLIQEFREFAEITEFAAVTYQQVDSGAKGKLTGELKFNFYTDPEQYESALKSRYVELVTELEGAISDKYLKIEKLNFLSQHIIEAAALNDLIVVSAEGILHLNFKYTNLTTLKNLKAVTFNQGDVQGYLVKTRHYITKLQRYLAELKHNLEITKQEEFNLPGHMLADPNQSSLENPLAWFEYVVFKNGLDALRNYFKPSQDEHDYGYASYDEKTETKTNEQQDPETGEWETTTYRFQDFLLNRLYKEFYKTRDLMETVISQGKSKKQIKLAFTFWLSKLFYLKATIEKGEQVKRYEAMPKPIDAFIRYLYEKYPAFCSKPGKTAKGLLEIPENKQLAEPRQLSLPAAAHPGVFRWIKNEPAKNSMILHTKLNGVFIENISLENFHKAFVGGLPENINIRWIDRSTNNLHVNKVTLLYLFKSLSENGLIDVGFDDPEMFRKLTFIFRDPDGKTLDNFKQSKQSLLSAKKPKTYMKTQIDAIIKAMMA